MMIAPRKTKTGSLQMRQRRFIIYIYIFQILIIHSIVRKIINSTIASLHITTSCCKNNNWH